MSKLKSFKGDEPRKKIGMLTLVFYDDASVAFNENEYESIGDDRVFSGLSNLLSKLQAARNYAYAVMAEQNQVDEELLHWQEVKNDDKENPSSNPP